MENFAKVLKMIDEGFFSDSELLSLLELISIKIDIETISSMARKEGKTPRGIRISNHYRKIKIGSQLMAVKGLKENNLPF